jgi:lysozyme
VTTPNLTADLMRDEGLRLEAYPDPKSGGAPWTIGYGHTPCWEGGRCSEEEAEQWLAFDIARLGADLDRAMPWWRLLDGPRQDALANMAFNLGMQGLTEFTTFLRLMRAGAYAAAAVDLESTAWWDEVGERARRIADQIATGEHQP